MNVRGSNGIRSDRKSPFKYFMEINVRFLTGFVSPWFTYVVRNFLIIRNTKMISKQIEILICKSWLSESLKAPNHMYIYELMRHKAVSTD